VVETPRTPGTATVTQTLVGVTQTLVGAYDVTELLQQLVDAYVTVLHASAAGLLLSDQRGALRLAVASDERIEELELLQLGLGEGPCVDCVRGGQPVFGADLANDPARWRRFAPAAVEAGYHAVHALPVRLNGWPCGGINLFYRAPTRPSEDDVLIGQALADLATLGMLQHHSGRRAADLTHLLEDALRDRAVIARANGLLAESGDLGSTAARYALRGYAHVHGLHLGQLARDITDGILDPQFVLAEIPGVLTTLGGDPGNRCGRPRSSAWPLDGESR
jgi:hypothetical protein